jgi:hypothetical protein
MERAQWSFPCSGSFPGQAYSGGGDSCCAYYYSEGFQSFELQRADGIRGAICVQWRAYRLRFNWPRSWHFGAGQELLMLEDQRIAPQKKLK